MGNSQGRTNLNVNHLTNDPAYQQVLRDLYANNPPQIIQEYPQYVQNQDQHPNRFRNQVEIKKVTPQVNDTYISKNTLKLIQKDMSSYSLYFIFDCKEDVTIGVHYIAKEYASQSHITDRIDAFSDQEYKFAAGVRQVFNDSHLDLREHQLSELSEFDHERRVYPLIIQITSPEKRLFQYCCFKINQDDIKILTIDIKIEKKGQAFSAKDIYGGQKEYKGRQGVCDLYDIQNQCPHHAVQAYVPLLSLLSRPDAEELEMSNLPKQNLRLPSNCQNLIQYLMFSEIDSELVQIKEFITSIQLTHFDNLGVKESEVLHQVIELASILVCKLEECHSAYEDQITSLQFDCEFHISAQEQLEKQITEMNTTNRQLVQRISDLELRDFQVDLIQQTNVETADKLKYIEGDLTVLENEKKQLLCAINNLKMKNAVLEENLARSHQFNTTIQLENLLQQKQLLKQNFLLAKLKKKTKQQNMPQSMCQQYFDGLKKKYQIQSCLNSTKSLEYEDEEECQQRLPYSEQREQQTREDINNIGSQNSIKLHPQEHIPTYDRFHANSPNQNTHRIKQAELMSYPLLSLANINYEMYKENAPQKCDDTYHSFFKLLVQSAKLNCTNFNQAVLINLDYLYAQFIDSNISFNKWYKEIVKVLDDLLGTQVYKIHLS